MLDSNNANDYIISSGNTYSLKQFVNLTFNYFGLDADQYLISNKEFIRPSDIKNSYMNPNLIYENLGWKSTKNLQFIVENMINDNLF